jgi:hypothetical protein
MEINNVPAERISIFNIYLLHGTDHDNFNNNTTGLYVSFGGVVDRKST